MAPPTPSLLDWGQIIQRVFDESSGLIRTNTVFAPNPGSLEVIITQSTDSIAIGDGNKLYTGTDFGSKHALDVNVLNSGTASSTIPYISSLSIPNANTEYSYNVPDGTIVLFIKSTGGQLKLAFQSGGPTLTIRSYGIYTVDNINTSSITLYLQSSNASDIVEIHGWHI